jgi:hypothetical protein
MSSFRQLQRRRLWGVVFGVAAVAVAIGGFAFSRRRSHRDTRQVRDDWSTERIDETVADSFPASDPPSWSPVIGAM